MAAAITTTATTLEGQLLEIAGHIQLGELAVPAETRPNNIQVTSDYENQLISVAFSCPMTLAVNSAGAIVAAPTTYLP
ncbi:hypothetical protein [Nostoc sp.]|uniref:hypothetical protein n=1 Tax=Nostoc sp. TaxID=1180 RepID=UPI002FF7CFA3